MRDVAATRGILIHVFERIYFRVFLQHLKGYTRVTLTNELTELVGKIMTQLLSILAFSAKAMAAAKSVTILSMVDCVREDAEGTHGKKGDRGCAY